MPQNSGYNGNTDFLKWYKTHYGVDYDGKSELTRKEGMSDGDWNVGTILQNYYIKSKESEAQRAKDIAGINERYDGMVKTAEAGYDSARKRLGESAAVAKQNASITYEKLKKYLPMQQKAQGLGGLGTQSSELAAYNRYMSQMGGIESDYQSNMTAIDDSQTEHIGELERYRTESIEDKEDMYDSLSRAYEENADNESRDAWDRYLKEFKDGQDKAYDLAMKSLSSSQSSSLEELLAFLAGYNGKVTDEQYKSLTEYAKSVADTNSKKEADASAADKEAAYKMAMQVLSSSTAVDPAALMAYISQYQGKVSHEQYAALEQYARNVAEANAKTKTDADQAAAAEIAEIVIGGMLDSGDYEGARKYLDSNKALLGSATVDAYQGVIDSYVKESDRIAEEEKKTEHDNRITSGQESFSYNGMEYRITEAYDGNIVDKLGDSQLKTFKNAGYSGPYDPSLPNGTTIAVGTGYFTYYNGKWYKSMSLGKSTTPQGTESQTKQEDFEGPPLPPSFEQNGIQFPQQPGGSSSAVIPVGTPSRVSASDAMLHAYGAGAAQDPVAQAGQLIGSWISKYLFGK